LFLGPAENSPVDKIAGFCEHASSLMLSRFGLDVDRRGELGEDKADVLFFQDNWELPRLREFRSQLLKDNNIKKAYDAAPQFGGINDWTPHLTLGYPDSPAKPTKERIYWVQFDRIAVWDGDFSGPEYILKNDYAMEVAMSGTSAQGRQFLSHFGVKGMRWGVRKDAAPGEIGATTTKTLVKRHAKVKVKGAGGHDATPDAVDAAVLRSKLKKSGAAALANHELRTLSERLQLEVNVKRLDKENSSEASKFIKKELSGQAKEVGRTAVREASKAAGKAAIAEAKRRK
jgi:hypothetical protein